MEVSFSMVNIYDHAHSLARALKESQEYRALAAAREKIKGKSAVENMIKDYHSKQMELQSLQMQGKEPSEAQKAAFEQLAGIIQNSVDARDYLIAEARFGTILQDVYKIIGEAVEIDLIPFAEQ